MGSDTGVSGGVVTILKSGKRQMSHTSDIAMPWHACSSQGGPHLTQLQLAESTMNMITSP